MTNSPTKPAAPLSEEALAEIEKRPSVKTDQWCLHRVLITESERDALCQTVRALREESAEWEHQARLNQQALGNALNDVTALREQLDEWRSVAEKYQALVARTETDTTTRMREACVAVIRGVRHKSEPDDSRWNAALYHAETRVESLTLDQVEQVEQKQ